jgi:two-component sensor histidine kinase
LLLLEMNHRMKNIFAVVSAVIGLSERNANAINELATDLGARVNALAVAHQLTLPDIRDTVARSETATMFALVLALFFVHQDNGVKRVSLRGDDCVVQGPFLTSLGLFLHEFATGVVKYGALSTKQGRVEIGARPR